MGLLPLEFTDCLTDSPYFRESLHSHEKELERTSNNIKELVKEVKNLLQAAKRKSFLCTMHYAYFIIFLTNADWLHYFFCIRKGIYITDKVKHRKK